ncbi:MAG TPA: helix-turn-helix domain-containing protein [Pyrinomonadaceae bacterium]|jgi:transcriptional regulator with PAS, ATPase and Fis domain|nr:helix-turn-helix domain-containing protein [Pyrinomonadaceae bacterium]
MRAERIGATGVESSGEIHQPCGQESPANGLPRQLKFSQRPARNRIQRLLDIAGTLLQETETLARDKAFTEEANRVQGLNVSEGIDFYAEVERFETSLIRLALDQTRGHQARAAKLLRIKPTTLNSKIKLYRIEY